MTDLSIIIVSYNTRDDLARCLTSLQDHPPSCTSETVVVDNGSTDGSVELVRTAWPDVRLIEIGKNVGFGAANNRAARATQSDFILFLNSDTEVSAGAVDRLVDTLRSTPGVAVVGPRLVDGQGHAELSFGAMITPWNEAWQKLKRQLLARRVPVFGQWVAHTLTRPSSPDWVSGACLLVRRANAEAAGLFDERFFLYVEDVDLCASIRQLGGRVLFTPEVEIVHHRGRSGQRAPAPTAAWYRRSQIAFYEKHHPIWVPLLRLYLALKGALPQESNESRG